MCTTLTKLATVLALIGAVVISAVAISLTVGTAADACTLNSDRMVGKLAAPSTEHGAALTIFDRDCLDWHPVK